MFCSICVWTASQMTDKFCPPFPLELFWKLFCNTIQWANFEYQSSANVSACFVSAHWAVDRDETTAQLCQRNYRYECHLALVLALKCKFLDATCSVATRILCKRALFFSVSDCTVSASATGIQCHKLLLGISANSSTSVVFVCLIPLMAWTFIIHDTTAHQTCYIHVDYSVR